MAYCTQDELLLMITVEELSELTTEMGEAPDLMVVE
jgi:hypothetical protein